jgi:tRNA pseudouridine38-40 synthase
MDRGRRREGSGRRIALLVQYDGTDFCGFQIQDNGRTVQQEIEKGLKVLLKETIRIKASGRTDSGVHALGQIIHFDTLSNTSLDRICLGLNGIFSRDVSIKNAFDVNPSFDSRFSAVEREYIYLIYNHPQRTPFMKYRAMWLNSNIDLDYMKETARILVGEHDFKSFCKKISAEDNTVRTINSIEIDRNYDLISIKISGNAFLHNMIRIIVGTVVEMYKEGRNPSYIKQILGKKDRDYSGKTAPAHGLYLSRVLYNPELSTYPSAY